MTRSLLGSWGKEGHLEEERRGLHNIVLSTQQAARRRGRNRDAAGRWVAVSVAEQFAGTPEGSGNPFIHVVLVWPGDTAVSEPSRQKFLPSQGLFTV